MYNYEDVFVNKASALRMKLIISCSTFYYRYYFVFCYKNFM